MSGFGDALMVPALEQHHSPAAWAAVNTPGLDAISATPLAAFSATRRLRTAYTGPCMRIRRTDNAELDVGFGADNLLDAAAIATFCAGSTGYVKTWYDQSGHGNDVTQSVTTKQPIIYASGAITVNSAGKAAFHLDGVDDYMGRADALGLTGSPALTVGSVIQSASADAWGWGFGGTAANASWDFELYKGGSNLAITQTSGGFRNFNWAWQTGVHQYICGKAAAATSGSWTCEQDGIALSQQSAHGAPSALNLANSVFNIGTGATVGQSGVWGEEYTNFIVVYNAVLAGADSVALRNEQAQHSIPGPGDLIAIADQRS
ncbi:MAG TPA: arabinofuranosidase catalytic domain-containing protein, partial [Steroidobacteraceae bacterium]|nr:arabinofuranosidase catalytic domain-containing protein [Steroidobacteraceae bacterium]